MATNNTYIHPSVSSTITDNSAVYLTADGTTKLFAVFTSEKGEDNVITTVTSVSELEFKYGKPNIKLYGQIGYNIVNWLNAGGIVYCLRVLPEDAGYANAIVNIQTKVGSKEVHNIDGDLVTIDDVTLRPIVTYTSVNNISKEALESNELQNDSISIDGFKNHMLFAVVPKGRGKAYNTLGFKLTLLDSMDTTYEFRLYNFEVTEETSTGAINTIQGPFVVSLDPDAVSLSGESMFIKNVVSQYCDYFDVIFNEDAYNDLGEVVNPNVNPNRLDFFNGQTRVLAGDVNETFYCDETGQDEDVHIYITKYDIDHQPTSVRNIVDVESNVETVIVNIDNTYRANEYQKNLDTYNHMKESYSLLRKKRVGDSNPLKTKLDPIIAELDGKFNQQEGDPNPTYTYPGIDDLNTAVEALRAKVEGLTADETLLTADITAEYNSANTSYKLFKNEVENVEDLICQLYDYCHVTGDSADTLEITVTISDLDKLYYGLENHSIKMTSISSKLSDLGTLRDELLEENDDGNKQEFVSSFLAEAVEILETLSDNDVPDSDIANKYLTYAQEVITNIQDCYDVLADENTLDADYEEAMDGDANAEPPVKGAFDYIEEVIDLLRTASDLIFIELVAKDSKDISDLLVEAYMLNKIYVQDVITQAGTGDLSTPESLEQITNYITVFKNTTLSSSLQDTFTHVLQDFNDNVRLMFGTDGIIEDATPNDPNVISLISQGYRGIIDPSLNDKDRWPIDVVLDANYNVAIKNAIITLTSEMRKDFIAILDTNIQATPQAAINFRKSSLGVSDFRVAIFTQDMVVSDYDYTGYKMQVTPTYFLSSKIPTNDNSYGIHMNFVGPRRGVISGFESISFIPNSEWKEQLYRAQVNYIERDQVSTRFGCQLTSQVNTTALSNLNNVRAILRMQRDIEDMMKDYQFEYNDATTRAEAQANLSSYLTQWLTNRCCTSISGSVYASEYDIQQKIMRVQVEMVFNNVIERVYINLTVNN